jgi:hypothetical protein
MPFNESRYRITTNPLINQRSTPLQENNKKSVLDQLSNNLKEQDWFLNHVSFKDALKSTQSKSVLNKHTEQLIKNLFPAHASQLLNNKNTFVNKFLPGAVVDIYSEGNDLYAEGITSSSTNTQTSVLYRVGAEGLEFIECRTNSTADYEQLMGVTAANQNWHKQRDRNTWAWLEKNFRVFEPVFADSYITPFNQRLSNAYHDIMDNNNPYQSSEASFMGWPGDESYHKNGLIDSSLKLAKYIITAGFLTPIKNIVKLGFELVPAILEEVGCWILDNSKKAFKTSNTVGKQALAVVGIASGALIYGASKLVRQIAMRATSPIRSAKEAYEFGKKAHVFVGGLFAAISIALSALLIAASFLVSSIAAIALIIKPKTAIDAIGYAMVATVSSVLVVPPAVPAGMGIKVAISNIWENSKTSSLNTKTTEAKNTLEKNLRAEQSQTPTPNAAPPLIPSHHSIRSALQAEPVAKATNAATDLPIAPPHITQFTTATLGHASGSFINQMNPSENKNEIRAEESRLSARI